MGAKHLHGLFPWFAVVTLVWVGVSLITGKTIKLYNGSGPFIADREKDAFFYWFTLVMVTVPTLILGGIEIGIMLSKAPAS
jgi:hypothetical protein